VKSIPPETAWLVDIAAACERIAGYLRGVDKSAFLANSEKRYAVYAQLIIIGEAASRFRPEYRDAHPTIPWRKMIGMRNRIVHEYDSIDWNIVWETATMHIPELLSALQPFLPPMRSQ
jgi:uncharacterized protein with HEPN domain